MIDPALTQMMQRYEHLVRELDSDDTWRPGDNEKMHERVELFYALRKRGFEPDTRTDPWSWIPIKPDQEEEFPSWPHCGSMEYPI